jgi:SAM-dependent methyltransferase
MKCYAYEMSSKVACKSRRTILILCTRSPNLLLNKAQELNMHSQYIQRGKNVVKRLLGLGGVGRRAKTIYEGKGYLEAYSQHTDLRVEADPKSAIGGKWEEIGQLQFDLLLNQGLQPHHKMLDVGCGTLRGGRHAIRYLNAGNYSGIDISPKAIEHAKQLVQQEGLFEKGPRLVVSEKMNLQFREFSGETFDFILAQSVFTHLKPEHITECFEYIGDIMDESSAFYFTYTKGEAYGQIGRKGFCYPFSFFESLAGQFGFNLRDCSKEYNHPRGQLMVETRKKQ